MSDERLESEAEVDEALLGDPLVQEVIEDSLAPYRRAAAPELLRSMRRILEEALTTDPYAVALLKRARAERDEQASEEGARVGAAEGGESGTLVRGGGTAEARGPGESATLVRGGATVDEASEGYGRRGRGA
jgi:hypothetical protein